MDVTTPPPLPPPSALTSRRRRLSLHLAATGAAPAPTVPGAVQVRGAPDGADLQLPSGIRVRRTAVGAAHVTATELQQALMGIAMLPATHQALIARSGIVIELVPVAALENGILGATSIEQSPGGPWMPTLVRVAVRSPLSAAGTGRTAVGEIAQHELGHVIAVLTGQDRSEAAAERYALTH